MTKTKGSKITKVTGTRGRFDEFTTIEVTEKNGYIYDSEISTYTFKQIVGMYMDMLISTEQAFGLDLKIEYDEKFNNFIHYTDPKGDRKTIRLWLERRTRANCNPDCHIITNKDFSTWDSLTMGKFADLLSSYGA